jgi:hypothetical protein
MNLKNLGEYSFKSNLAQFHIQQMYLQFLFCNLRTRYVFKEAYLLALQPGE